MHVRWGRFAQNKVIGVAARDRVSTAGLQDFQGKPFGGSPRTGLEDRRGERPGMRLEARPVCGFGVTRGERVRA